MIRFAALPLLFAHGANVAAFADMGLLSAHGTLSIPDSTRPAAKTVNPHGEIGLNCETCHTTENWKKIRKDLFDHGRDTGFLLEGQHADVACAFCHNGLVFYTEDGACADCHMDAHQGELGVTCDNCHTPDSWQPFEFPVEHAMTRFPLFGAHVTTDCQSCHATQQEGEFAALPTDCMFCHIEAYAATINPGHAAANLDTRCENCHTTIAWSPAEVDHSQLGFVLDGAHSNLDCELCHEGGAFVNTPAECEGCHLDDYNSAADPNHATSGFPTDCEICHSTSPGWRPAFFSHDDTAFPLTGAHRQIEADCQQCHADGFTGTPTLCFACHEEDYANALDPVHVSLPTECEECHNTVDWVPSTFDHEPLFPINSGSHQGTWVGCGGGSGDGAGCHTTVNLNEFSCIHCHDHDQAEMDDKHDEVAGYVYQSQACFDCHPDGLEN